MEESDRIKSSYEKRKKTDSSVYSYFNHGTLLMAQEKERELINLLKKFKFDNLYNKKILDVGCGSGGLLMDFIKYGANPENLFGIDLLNDRVNRAVERNPRIHYLCRDAAGLPYENEKFDIVIQFTVFTSILDQVIKKKISAEMLRVLNRNGIILWYDFLFDNPSNPDVKGIKKAEIQYLFDGNEVYLKKITLAPPIIRFVSAYSPAACYLLAKIPLLCTHYIGVIRKPQKGPER